MRIVLKIQANLTLAGRDTFCFIQMEQLQNLIDTIHAQQCDYQSSIISLAMLPYDVTACPITMSRCCFIHIVKTLYLTLLDVSFDVI
jgi:hypothetical protein